jgi:hypothetical protein
VAAFLVRTTKNGGVRYAAVVLLLRPEKAEAARFRD